MKYTKQQANRLAQQIKSRFGELIQSACAGSSVEPSFLAGFIAVEAGRDKNGKIDPNATRFEKGVYAHLLKVRDGGQKSYNKITPKMLDGMGNAALKNLATSYNLTQIMGWWVFQLHCTIADLRDTNKHLPLAVKLFQLTANPYLKKKDYEAVLRIWNTGKPTGKTYDPDYIFNALSVKSACEQIKDSRSTALLAAGEANTPAPVGVFQQAVENPSPADTGSAAENSNTSQTAENITNVTTGDKGVPDNFTPETKDVAAPASDGSTAKAAKLTVAGFAVPTFLVGVVQAIQSALANGYIDAKSVGDAVIGFISNNTKYFFGGIGLVIVGMILKKAWKQLSFMLSIYLTARPDRHDIVIVPGAVEEKQ